MSKCDYCKDDEVVRQSKRDVFSPVKWICENCFSELFGKVATIQWRELPVIRGRES